MPTFAEPKRIDTLLALSLAYDQGGPAAGAVAPGEGAARSGVVTPTPLEILSALGEADRRALRERAAWHARLTPEAQSQWLMRTLRGAPADQPAPLDEHVHPSHVIEVLRAEPPRVRSLVLQNLPPLLAQTCAAALYAARGEAEGGGEGQAPSRRPHAPGEGVRPEFVALIRRLFMSHFVAAGAWGKTRALDLLSGVELARLVRRLGVRETAAACRGIESKEAVGSFLRRFSAEDAPAIAAHIAGLTDVAPNRVAFAEGLVHESFGLTPEPEAMLDWLGVRLLAAALATFPPARARYIKQKLPSSAAKALSEMIEQSRRRDDPAMVRLIAAEVEDSAADLRRPRKPARKPAAPAPPQH